MLRDLRPSQPKKAWYNSDPYFPFNLLHPPLYLTPHLAVNAFLASQFKATFREAELV